MERKILILSPYLPWPLDSGGNVGVYYMLSYISEYVDVTYMSIYNKKCNNWNIKEELQKRLPRVKFVMYDYRQSVNKKYEYVRKLQRRIDERVFFGPSCSKILLNSMEQITPGLVKFINEYIVAEGINIVQVEFLSFLPMVYLLPTSVKKIFIHHELGYVRDDLSFNKDLCTNVVKLYRKDIEFMMLNRYDVVATLTNVDAEKLKEEGCKAQIEVSTLAICDKTKSYEKQAFDRRLTFVGGSGHFPNYDGMLWFVKEVFPMIKRHTTKDIKIEIVGRWSDNCRRALLDICPDIIFHGFVDNLETIIRGSIMVIPIKIGSGMRMKILEAANHSVPFVTTPVGVEGLDFHDGMDCYIASDVEKMATDIIKIATAPNEYEKLAKNAHLNFERNYSYEILGSRRLELYK